MQARLEALEKMNHEEKLRTQLDAKLDKEEFANFVSLLQEETISPMQKEIDKCKKDIQCIEVSTINCEFITLIYLIIVFPGEPFTSDQSFGN